eukprot:7541734-Karenia_brevis.AAC.1
MKQNEELLHLTLSAAAELGPVPMAILSDLNVEPHRSILLQAALHSGRWVDAAVEYANACGSEPQET